MSVRFESGALGAISGICPCDYGYDARSHIREKGCYRSETFAGNPWWSARIASAGFSPIYRSWPERFGSAYVREMKHFRGCVRNGSQPSVNGRTVAGRRPEFSAATKIFPRGAQCTIAEVLDAVATRRASEINDSGGVPRPRRSRVEQWPTPSAATGEIVLRMEYASICATDLRIIRGAHCK